MHVEVIHWTFNDFLICTFRWQHGKRKGTSSSGANFDATLRGSLVGSVLLCLGFYRLTPTYPFNGVGV